MIRRFDEKYGTTRSDITFVSESSDPFSFLIHNDPGSTDSPRYGICNNT